MKEICVDREFENFYCPVTGQKVLQPDDYFPSPALVFIYLEEFECFQYVIPEIAKNFPQHFDGQGETLNGKELLKKLKKEFYKNSDKLIITYGTMGTASMCFDLGYEAE